jgi:mevalonate kinase
LGSAGKDRGTLVLTDGVSTPYQIHLAGGYTVLLGGPAICLAIEPRLEIQITENESVLPGPTEEMLALDNPFVREIFRSYSSREAERIIGLLRMQDRMQSWGAGSSAALTVSLLALLDQLEGRKPVADDLFSRARAIHRKVQGGEASGCDIGACVYGGCLIVGAAAGEALPRVMQVEWPSSLGICLLHAGDKTATVGAIDSFLVSYEKNGSDRTLLELALKVGDVAALLAKNDATGVLAELHNLLGAEQQFERVYRVNYFGKSWRVANDKLAKKVDPGICVCLPQGAGGDDAAVVLYRRDKLTFADIEHIFNGELRLLNVEPARGGVAVRSSANND